MSTVTTHAAMFPGRLDLVAEARGFVAGLVAGLPCADEVVLCASELAANAIEHSASGEPGGTFRIELAVLSGTVTLTVTDQGESLVPRQRRPACEAGRGLLLVEDLADDFTRRGRQAVAVFGWREGS
ncbi:ATP-binding protein [Planomonospora sp. ID82291]|uniref:ATP-binding protein n=1 Tax=Planomonospora sp. ID82291 TaxID=2738136 RepID=UPI0018C35D5D|nr:ATP-binding protein [Planomonospora sp. ID82291]MBG0819093.1 ATP-binding protein [Planomonospora sp. ID82291]